MINYVIVWVMIGCTRYSRTGGTYIGLCKEIYPSNMALDGTVPLFMPIDI